MNRQNNAGFAVNFCVLIIHFLFSETGEVTLRISPAALDDSGTYTCIASNDVGSVTSSAYLRVIGQLIFIQCSKTKRLTVTGRVIDGVGFFVGTSCDGILWKDNFESLYTEVMELGRYRTNQISSHTGLAK